MMMCSGCSRYFTGLVYFDRHRKPTPTSGKCLDPETIKLTNGKPAMVLRPGKFGSQEVMGWGGEELSEEQKERLAKMRPAKDTT